MASAASRKNRILLCSECKRRIAFPGAVNGEPETNGNRRKHANPASLVPGMYTPVSTQHEIAQRSLQGQNIATIAKEMKVAKSVVRKVLNSQPMEQQILAARQRLWTHHEEWDECIHKSIREGNWKLAFVMAERFQVIPQLGDPALMGDTAAPLLGVARLRHEIRGAGDPTAKLAKAIRKLGSPYIKVGKRRCG